MEDVRVKICSVCGIEKPITEYYVINRSFCKVCEREKQKQQWFCDVCDRSYLRKNKKAHIESRIHIFCNKHKIKNTNILPQQNRRRYEVTENIVITPCPPSPTLEITDDMIMKVRDIMAIQG